MHTGPPSAIGLYVMGLRSFLIFYSGIDFWRQNLMSMDVIFQRPRSIPVLKGLNSVPICEGAIMQWILTKIAHRVLLCSALKRGVCSHIVVMCG